MPGHGDAIERDGQRGLSGDVKEAWGNPGAGVGDAVLAPPTDGETELPTLSYSGSCEDPARSQHSICFPLWKDAGQKGAATTWVAGMSGTKNCMRLWPTHHLFVPVMGDMAGVFLWYWVNRTGKLHWYYLEMADVFPDVSPLLLCLLSPTFEPQVMSKGSVKHGFQAVFTGCQRAPQSGLKDFRVRWQGGSVIRAPVDTALL